MAIDLADRAMVIAPAAATDLVTGIAQAVPATAALQAGPETAIGPVALVTEMVPGVLATMAG